VTGSSTLSDPITADPEASLEEIAKVMVRHNIDTLPLLDQGRLVGITGKEDLLRMPMPSRNILR
jgi:CBS domain-containing protein